MRTATACAPLLAALPLPGGAWGATLAAIDQDGWYTWRVEGVADAPAQCCVAARRHAATDAACDLDNRHANYGPQGVSGDSTSVQIYARIESGSTTRLRGLSPSCPVQAESRIVDLGDVDTAESVRWLRRRTGTHASVDRDALAAIAAHSGEASLTYLTDAANGATAGVLREDAIFWLGQARIAEASGTLERLMSSAESPRIRQYAAFSLSQSTAPGRAAALIRQGRQDADEDTRARAWLRLAQTGVQASEAAIMQAVRADPSASVRDEAVFALSRLPGERAVNALLAVLESRELDRSVREEALLWLAQSESERGLAVVEYLITGGTGRIF